MRILARVKPETGLRRSCSAKLSRSILQMEFRYSKNCMSVAISRARTLAVVIANPALLKVDCNTPEQMALVNTLCWISDYAKESA